MADVKISYFFRLKLWNSEELRLLDIGRIERKYIISNADIFKRNYVMTLKEIVREKWRC